MNIEILSNKFSGVKKSGDKYTAICPAHDDKHNSLSIFTSDNNPNKLVVKCHAGCNVNMILSKIGLSISDLYIEKKSYEPKSKIVAEYNYKDLQGNLIHQTVRYHPKKFLQRRPDGKGGWIWNLKEIETILYNLADVVSLSKTDDKFVVICEGEKDCDNLKKYGFVATTNAGGATHWKTDYNKIFTGYDVVIIPDDDDVGFKHAEVIKDNLRNVANFVEIINWKRLRCYTYGGKSYTCSPKQDISDYIEFLESVDKKENEPNIKNLLHFILKKEKIFLPHSSEQILENKGIINIQEDKEVVNKDYSTWEDLDKVTSEVSWSWHQWLPNGLLTILASESGKGKSYIALKIAASFINGTPFPDGTKLKENELGKILWCEAESAEAVNLQRAKHWKLPLDKIVTPFPNPIEQIDLDNNEHRERILKVSLLPEIKYIVVDSLSGSNRKDENKSEVAGVVKYLAEVAKQSGKPVVLIHHLNKPMQGTENQAVTLHRLRGSSAIVQYARVIWAIDEPNTSDTQHRRLSVIKSNLSRFPKPIGYEIDDDSNLTFREAPEAIVSKNQSGKAKELLNTLLTPGKKVLMADIKSEAEKLGISMDTVRRVKDESNNIKSKYDGKNRQWSWEIIID